MSERSHALVLGSFERVEDWTSYVGHAVNGITQWWICYRGMDGGERDRYRAALREAHAAMRQLGEFALSVATGTLCLGAFDVDAPGPVLLYIAEDAASVVNV